MKNKRSKLQIYFDVISAIMTEKQDNGEPDQGPCTDLEFMDYITAYGKQCKCGKNDWELLAD